MNRINGREGEYIKKFKGDENKLFAYLEKKGIIVSMDLNVELNNFVFTKKDKELKISFHSFYRYSGICSLYKEGEDKKLEIIKVTDEMYLENFIKPIIELYFKD